MKNQTFVSREDALDILFANRNRAYGAYQLRRQYPAALARALGIGLLLIAFMMLLPQIMKAFSSLLPDKELHDEAYVITEVKLTPPPTAPPPPLPSTPPPPARATQRFVPPIVEDDDKVQDEPPKLTNDDLLNDPSEIGKATIEGPADGPPSLDDPGLVSLVETPEPSRGEEVLELFDLHKPPSFPGGEAELMRYLAKNIEYPKVALETGIEGVVVLSFVIDKKGDINNITVLKEVGGGCSKEAIRVLKTMPQWTPGEANGHAVNVRFTLPVRFKVK